MDLILSDIHTHIHSNLRSEETVLIPLASNGVDILRYLRSGL